MKKFTKEEIAKSREMFWENGFPEVYVNLEGREFSYFVLPQSLEPNIQNFVYRCTGEFDDEYVLGISDNVKPEYRKYAVAHEFIEFMEIEIDGKGRCSRALDEELKLVPENIKPDYLEMRRDFFRDLVDYCSKHPEFYTNGDISQFRGNAERLEKILKN